MHKCPIAKKNYCYSHISYATIEDIQVVRLHSLLSEYPLKAKSLKYLVEVPLFDDWIFGTVEN